MTSLGRSGQPRLDPRRPVDEPLPKLRPPQFLGLCKLCGTSLKQNRRHPELCHACEDLAEELDP